MKLQVILTVGVCLLFASVPIVADQAEDEAAIKKAEEMYLKVYNAHDAKAVAATYVDGPTETWGGTSGDRATVEKLTAEAFAGRRKNLHIKLLEEISIVFVTPDVAIYKARLEFSGRIDVDGKTLPPSKALYAKVYVKKNGKWLGAHGVFNRPIEQ